MFTPETLTHVIDTKHNVKLITGTWLRYLELITVPDYRYIEHEHVFYILWNWCSCNGLQW